MLNSNPVLACTEQHATVTGVICLFLQIAIIAIVLGASSLAFSDGTGNSDSPAPEVSGLLAGIPAELQMVYEDLDAYLSDDNKEYLKQHYKEKSGAIHMGLGMHIRNKWLYDHEDSQLVKFFSKRGQRVPDYISEIILEGYVAYLSGRTYDIETRIKNSFDPNIPRDLRSPTDGLKINFFITKTVSCKESDLRRFNISEGKVIGFKNQEGKELPPLPLLRDGEKFYIVLDPNDKWDGKVELTCGEIYLGTTNTGEPWAYSVEKGLFPPDDAMKKSILERTGG